MAIYGFPYPDCTWKETCISQGPKKMAMATHMDDFETTYTADSIDRLMDQVTPEQQEETDFKMLLAAKIYHAMKRKGWTQTHFAEVANQHVSVISKWLSGTHNFTVETLVAIQRILEIHLLDVEEPKFKALLNIKLTVSSEILLSEEEIGKTIYAAGGMLPTSVKQEFFVEG